MRKKIIILLMILVFLFSSSIFLICFFTKRKEGLEQQSNLTVPMGSFPDAKYILSATEIADLSICYEDGIPVVAIIDREAGYEKIYDEFLKAIRRLGTEDFLDTSAEESSLYGEEGCFVSVKSIRFWAAYANHMSTEEWILIFSKDFQKMMAVQIFIYDGEIRIGSCGYNSKFMEKVHEEMLASPEEKFIFLFTGKQTLMLNSQNQYWYAGYLDKTITIEGDYYHMLDYETIGISYNEITMEENLIWVDF